jgi:hypothetical protein
MTITKLNYYKNPDRITRKVLLDTDRVKEKVKQLPERIEDINVLVDGKIDRFCGWLVDKIG